MKLKLKLFFYLLFHPWQIIPCLILHEMESVEKDVFDGKTLEEFLASKKP